MKVLAEETWSWMLIEHEGVLLFTVLCGGVAMYGVDFALSEAEQAEYHREGRSYLKRLAHGVTLEPSSYRSRKVADLDKLAGLHEAVAAWRASHARAP